MRRLLLCLTALFALSIATAQNLRPGRVVLKDNFNRLTASAPDFGTVPGTAYNWVKRVPVVNGKPLETLITASNGAVDIRYSSGNNPHDTGLAVDGFKVADAVISLVVGPTTMAGRAHGASLSYRAATVQAAAGAVQPNAYHVELAEDWSGSRDVLLRYGTETLAVADVAPVHSQTDSYRVRVAFVGDHHQVWLDGQRVIDYWESAMGRTTAGYVGFGGFYSAGTFDDFVVSEVRVGEEARTAADGQLRPLLFQGRPFFVLGTFDPPSKEMLPEWLAAGCNATLFHVAEAKLTAAQRRQQIEDDIAWARPHNIALIWYPIVDFYSHQDDKVLPARPADIPAKAAVLKEMLAVTAKNRQTFGYWTFDEPENHLYPAYKDWEQKKDQGLSEWMSTSFQWVYDTLKAADPTAYVMPTLGWWTTYEPAAAMYDVNVPNEYPQRGAPLTDDLYNAVYDAAKAADAVRAKGRTGFVYMPPCYDIIAESYRGATVREFRYLCFGPLTQGAQGLLPWRLNRATPAYQRTVIYPVYREINPLIPWLLGEVMEGKVSSDADQPTVDYLKQLPVRVKTLPGETIEKEEVAGVPDCSYILRRRPDNTYLLIAVSNRREPQTVTFTLKDLGELPATAQETIEYAQTPIVNGQIKEAFEPFGVRAWVIAPK